MNLLEFLPRLSWPFGDDLPVLGYFLEETEQMSPFPAFKEDRLCGKGARENLFVLDPTKIRAIEVTVGHLKFRARANLSSGGGRAGNFFLSDHLSQDFPSPLQLRQHKLTRPEEAQRIGGNDHDQSDDHDYTEGQSSSRKPDEWVTAFPEAFEHFVVHSYEECLPFDKLRVNSRLT